MILEFKVGAATGLLEAFAKVLGTTVEQGIVTLPERFGKGFIKGFDLDPRLRMMIRQYELKEDFTFRRIAAEQQGEIIAITFHNFFRLHKDKKKITVQPAEGFQLPFVQIASAGMDSEVLLPAHSRMDTIIIAVHKELLRELLKPAPGDTFLERIITADQPYLYEEISSPEMQDVADKILTADLPQELQHFYFKLRAEDLIYLFFVELLKRRHTGNYPLNVADVKMMYRIRDKINADLALVPSIPSLAQEAAMSESKMKRLFKQIFGSSIYNYYQALRMQEAAYLIREQKKSVSEAGYALGFSNLSHFSRIFERYIGLKPKKYTTSSLK